MHSGGAGPGGCDAAHWRVVLLQHGAHCSRLCDAVAALTRRFLNSIDPWDDISALVANRLIVLDKCLMFVPLVLERLFSMLSARLCYATRVDVELTCGSDQLCSGVRSGIEGVIHAITSLFL